MEIKKMTYDLIEGPYIDRIKELEKHIELLEKWVDNLFEMNNKIQGMAGELLADRILENNEDFNEWKKLKAETEETKPIQNSDRCERMILSQLRTGDRFLYDDHEFIKTSGQVTNATELNGDGWNIGNGCSVEKLSNENGA